jgi:hypothetical protein
MGTSSVGGMDPSALLADIEQVVSFGLRLPGHPADRATEAWLLERLNEIGLDDVHREPVPVSMWEWGEASVELRLSDHRGTETRELKGFPLPYSHATGGLEAEVVVFDEKEPRGARDRIVVEHMVPLELPQALLRQQATSFFDPDGDFDTLVQTLPFGPRLNNVLDPAVEAGAAGYLGLLTGFSWDTDRYYVPYDTAPRALSGMWVAAGAAEAVTDLLRRQQEAPGSSLLGRLRVSGRRSDTTCSNIVGRLPGADDQVVIVASHHDGPWASAVEDASGIALVLAQARYWASLPREERPHSFVFLLTAGHMAGGAGARAFVERHAPWFDRVVLAVHLEHVAAEARGDGARLALTGQPEPRWWFTSDQPALQAAVQGAIEHADLRRSLVLPCTVFGEAPPTDGADLYRAGLPVVQLLAAPVYLFDEADTLDKIHAPSLEPLTEAVVEIISAQGDATRRKSERAG